MKWLVITIFTMGRMHAPGKGISQSALPYRRTVPTWLKLTSEDVKDQIFKLSKKGLTPSQIGVILRDSHGVAQVRFVTGNKILRILKSKGLAPDLPEDIYYLVSSHLTCNLLVKVGMRIPTQSVLNSCIQNSYPSKLTLSVDPSMVQYC